MDPTIPLGHTMNTDYLRYTCGNIDYYIRPEQVADIVEKHGSIADASRMAIMQRADYAVDTSKNELVKCRQSLDNVLGAAFDVKPLVQDPERVVESLINLRNELLGRCDGNPALQEIVMKMNSCLHRKYPIHG